MFWDAMVSPSVYHGVTTVLAGNCGFTLAPLTGRHEDLDYLLGMLARVEGMPLESLEARVKPSWKTFGEFLDVLDGKVAINTAFMVGHSTLRARTMASAWRAASLCSWLASGVSETRARTRASSADSWTTANCSFSTANSSRARTSRVWTSLIRRSKRTRCMERQVYVAGNQRRGAPSCPRTASPGGFPTPGPAGTRTQPERTLG